MTNKVYITPAGARSLRDELRNIWSVTRPEVTQKVSDAAALGDRSENADYIYGKKRLREIDRRIRFLNQRLENAVVVNNSDRIANGGDPEQVFFGATVQYSDSEGTETTIRIVGVDEVDLERGYVSWVSPIAKALIKAKVGDTVKIQTPAGPKEIDIVAVNYDKL